MFPSECQNVHSGTIGMDSDHSFAPILGFGEVLPVRGLPRTKIRAESSSNGSDLRSAGFTPQKIRAETDNLPVSTRTRAHGRWQFMNLMKDFLLVPSVSVIALDGSA